MKESEKKGIIILAIIVVVFIGIVALVTKNKDKVEEEKIIINQGEEKYTQILNGGTKLNNSEILKSEKIIDGIKITNIQLIYKNGQTQLLANATNTTNQNKSVLGIYIKLLDKQGETIGRVPGAISSLKAGETKQLNINITEDYANVYDFKIEKQEGF